MASNASERHICFERDSNFTKYTSKLLTYLQLFPDGATIKRDQFKNIAAFQGSVSIHLAMYGSRRFFQSFKSGFNYKFAYFPLYLIIENDNKEIISMYSQKF